MLFKPKQSKIDTALRKDIERYILTRRIKGSLTFYATGPQENEEESLSSEKPKLPSIGSLIGGIGLPGAAIGVGGSKRHLSSTKIYNELEHNLSKKRITFSNKLFRIIDKKGMDEVSCYKKANVSRKVFSKIRSDKEYQPSKKTVLAFAVTLGISLEEAGELLKSAGYAFADSDDTDLIIQYFIVNNITDLALVNYALVDFGQPPLQ